jgi:hypothetical protein
MKRPIAFLLFASCAFGAPTAITHYVSVVQVPEPSVLVILCCDLLVLAGLVLLLHRRTT